MGKIQLLDCTLRDGGYINDWNFGEKNIIEMLNLLEESKVDILEVGFFKDEPYKKDRTVYNDAKQLEKQICPKKQGISYAAMVEVLNPLPAEKIAPCSEKTVDIIRVIVWKRLMNEGLEYCRRMIEKGYMVSVQPARVDQYSQEEFIDMIQLFNTISPWAFYVVDSWGNLNAEQLLVYMDLADQHLNTDILLGYHGHNNLMQAYGAAEQMICRNYGRDIVIDASVYGIGRGAGNLNTEVIAKHLNEHCGKNYNLSTYTEVYQGYIKDIYQQEPWGYSTAYYLTALYGCNPNYASYYDLTLHLPNDEIEAIFKLLSEEDKIIYTKEKADKYLRECRRHAFKMAVIIPTKNRLNDNCFYIQKVKDYFYDYNVDLIFYDGSDNNDLEQYIAQLDNPNILYDRYVETVKDDLTIDYKIYSATQKYAEQYDYVWFCRDRSIVHLESIYYALRNDAKKNRDFAIIYATPIAKEYFGYKIYDDASLMATELLGEITLLGSIVFSGKLLKTMVEEYYIDPVTNYGLWTVISLFHHIAKYPFESSFYAFNILEHMSEYSTSFWIKNDSLLWLFGERWKDMISSLPEQYNEVKEKIYNFTGWKTPPFGVPTLLDNKINGGLRFSNVIKLRRRIKMNAGIAYSKVLLISLAPRTLAKYLQKAPNSVICKFMKFTYKYFMKFPADAMRYVIKDIKALKYKTEYKKYSGTDYEQTLDCFEKNGNIKSVLLIGNVETHKNPIITIIIPTYKRVKLLKDALNSALCQKPVEFDWDIIVIDNEPMSEENQKNDTQKYIETIKSDRIKYYRNSQNLGVDGNMNRGVELAKGQWVSLLHDDDLLIDEYLIRVKRRIDTYSILKGKPLGYIANGCYTFYSDCLSEASYQKNIIDMWNHYLSNHKDDLTMKRLYRATLIFTGSTGICAPTVGTLILKKAYMETGGMNEPLTIVTDVVTATKIMQNYSVYTSVQPLGFYRWFDNYTYEKILPIMEDLYDFREYAYTINPMYGFIGKIFRAEYFQADIRYFFSLSTKITKEVKESVESIANTKPIKIREILFRVMRKTYFLVVTIQAKMNAKKAKKLQRKGEAT